MIADLCRSEWTKLRSVESTYWTAIAAAVATVLLGAVVCAKVAGTDQAHRAAFDAVNASLSGVYLAQIAAGTLGVLVISSEYGTGMIRATLGAVPQRRAMLAAKAAVFAAATLVVGEVCSVLAAVVGQALLGRHGTAASLADPTAVRAMIGAGLYLVAVGLLGFGLGALIRHTAGALTAFFALMFASPAVVQLLPHGWQSQARRYVPADCGTPVFATHHVAHHLGPWTGLGVLVGYAAVAVFAAGWLITRRDA